MKKFGLLILMLLAATQSVQSQPAPAAIFGCVYNATTPTYADKQTPALQCDINGQLKTTGGGSSSSGGGALNLTGINGVAPSAANPLFVAPGTGAIFTTTGTVGVTQVTSPWVVSGTVTAVDNYGISQLVQAPLVAALSGNTTIVTRVSGTIKVYGLYYACSAATTATHKDGTTTTLTGPMPLTTFFLPISNQPWYTTTSTNNFVLNTASSVGCSGAVHYRDN